MTAFQTQNEKEMVYTMQNGDEMRLTFNTVRKFLVTGKSDLVTEQELLFFMHECKARKLNPFLRQCWLIKYSEIEAAQIVEAIHHKRAKAMDNPTCEGWEKGIIIRCKDGSIKRSNGLILEGETLLGGWFKATPKGWKVPYELEINIDGYIKKKKDGNVTSFWAKDKQPSQIMKVVESQGLSALWGNSTGITYIEEELQDDDVTMVSNEKGKYERIQDTSAFDLSLIGRGFDTAALQTFLEITAKANSSTVTDLKISAADHFDAFWESFEKWQSKNKKKEPASTLPEDIQKQINECFILDAVAAKAALLEIGRDSISCIRDEKQADKFLKTFNQMLDEEIKGE